MDLNYFDWWNEEKKLLHTEGRYPYFKEGEIWWTQVGQNVDTEIRGKGKRFLRPVVILKKVYGKACVAIPLSSKARVGDYYFSFEDSKGKLQCALLPQIRYLDGKRLLYRHSFLDEKVFLNLKFALFNFLKK